VASQVTVGRRPGRVPGKDCATTWACTPRSTTSPAAGRSATSRTFTHLALIEAAKVLSGERAGTRSTTPAPLPRLPAPPRRPAPATLRRP